MLRFQINALNKKKKVNIFSAVGVSLVKTSATKLGYSYDVCKRLN